MSVLAIIPARAGSKRVPGKNTRLLGGRPMIAWTIECALRSCCDATVVSTESEEIAAVSRQHGADVPFLRSAALAGDESDVVDALVEVVERLQDVGRSYQSIALLQPTSPFRQVATVDRAIELHRQYPGDSVVSVSPAKIQPGWLKRIRKERLLPYIDSADAPEAGGPVSEPAYQLNGLVYICAVATLMEDRTLYSEVTRPLVIENEVEALDIDTPVDWLCAEQLVPQLSQQNLA